MSFLETLAEIKYGVYLSVGGGIGVLNSVLFENSDKIILTAVLAAVGALSSGLVKLVIDIIKKKWQK